MNIIFAVTANQVPVYERLTTLLEGSSAGKLENDSSNVVDLVRNQYDVSFYFNKYFLNFYNVLTF